MGVSDFKELWPVEFSYQIVMDSLVEIEFVRRCHLYETQRQRSP